MSNVGALQVKADIVITTDLYDSDGNLIKFDERITPDTLGVVKQQLLMRLELMKRHLYGIAAGYRKGVNSPDVLSTKVAEWGSFFDNAITYFNNNSEEVVEQTDNQHILYSNQDAYLGDMPSTYVLLSVITQE